MLCSSGDVKEAIEKFGALFINSEFFETGEHMFMVYLIVTPFTNYHKPVRGWWDLFDDGRANRMFMAG